MCTCFQTLVLHVVDSRWFIYGLRGTEPEAGQSVSVTVEFCSHGARGTIHMTNARNLLDAVTGREERPIQPANMDPQEVKINPKIAF